MLQQVARGEAGVDDVLHQQHVFAFDAFIQVFYQKDVQDLVMKYGLPERLAQ